MPRNRSLRPMFMASIILLCATTFTAAAAAAAAAAVAAAVAAAAAAAAATGIPTEILSPWSVLLCLAAGRPWRCQRPGRATLPAL